jgi:CubicO group peptidase (beta-lactamase class C family)
MRPWTVLCLAACTSIPDEPSEDLVDTDGADTDPGPAEPDPALLAELQTALDTSIVGVPFGVAGVGLWIRDREGRDLARLTSGDFAFDRRIPLASATKLVSGLVLLRLVTDGDLALTDTAAGALGWSGRAGAVTVDHLGAFTSGLPENAACTFNAAIDLADCVATMADEEPLANPGDRFAYGNAHLHVAAAMAEQRRAAPWNTVTADVLFRPLGLTDPGLTTYTFPRQGVGVSNPLVAGGLRATTDEYGPFLDLVLADGRHDGQVLVRPDLIARLYQNRYPDAEVAVTPLEGTAYDFRYGFTTWLECTGPVRACDVVSSPGSFGFTPWVDRKTGYWGILAMEGDAGAATTFAVPLEQQLRPTILALVASARGD